MKTWSADELRRFLSLTRSDRLHAAYLLQAMTGIRRGEALGLRWADVDLDRGRLSVRRSLVRVRNGWGFSEPKTDRSRCLIALDPATVSALRQHRKQQLQERMLIGAGYRANDLVFRPGRWNRHRAKLVLQGVRPSGQEGRALNPDARPSPTYASIALQAGIHPKVVSERLGHSSISITLDTYSHLIPSMQEEAAGVIAGLILGRDGVAKGRNGAAWREPIAPLSSEDWLSNALLIDRRDVGGSPRGST